MPKKKKPKKNNSAVVPVVKPREPQMLRCYLCAKVVRAGKDLAKHLVDSHAGLSLAQYFDMCPKQKPFDVSKEVILADDVYQAQVQRSLTGKWPEWYNADAPIVLDGAVELSQLLFSGFVAHKIELSQPLRFAAILYAQYLLDPAAIVSAARNKRTRERIAEALVFLRTLENDYGSAIQEVRTMFQAIAERTQALVGLRDRASARGRIVSSEFSQASERAKEVNAVVVSDPEQKKEITAQMADLAGLMQGLAYGGDHHLSEPPSEAEKKEKPKE